MATFTTDLEGAVGALPDVAETALLAIRDPGGNDDWPPSVCLGIDQNEAGQYRAAADLINREGFNLVCLQHAFGLYGGLAGAHILGLISALEVPVVTTFHTVLDRPNAGQRLVMDAILAASARVIVMTHKARDILIETYGADRGMIVIIPHGIPDAPLALSHGAKARLGYAERKVIATYGLICPNKGIENVIEAMPAIIADVPEAVYVVMGATHPHVLRDAGEAYRESLKARVRALGLNDHVVFLNRFAEPSELLEHIAMCDLYVTPYLDASQSISGALAYAHGMGRPVVSTPYWHAVELLADGSGVLVPFGDPVALGHTIGALLVDEPARLAMGRRAYAASRSMVWGHIAERYVDCFHSACREVVPHKVSGLGSKLAKARAALGPSLTLPETSNRHFIAMCDDTGIFQHAVHTIPDRLHGYCVDDNARALLLCCMGHNGLDTTLEATLTARFASFVQHAWNPDNGHFRNFMSFARVWLEPAGSQDSHGRTMWALGVCASRHAGGPVGDWAARLFREALVETSSFTSPRSWAFTLLGLDGYCRANPEDRGATQSRTALSDRLYHLLMTAQTADWPWFEDRLAYDNARLPEALIRTGLATQDQKLIHAGLSSLRWLTAAQTAPAGHFRPIGSHGFLLHRSSMPFDQQPLEATATIAACAAAHDAEPEGAWPDEAAKAFGWFLGANDLGLPLVDIAAGICCDGLHPDRVNQNSGAESVLAWLMALADMRALAPVALRHRDDRSSADSLMGTT